MDKVFAIAAWIGGLALGVLLLVKAPVVLLIVAVIVALIFIFGGRL